MDETRKLILQTCRSLIKLQSRLNAMSWKAKRYPNGTWETVPSWAVSDLDPPSSWLEGCPSNTAVSGVASGISLVLLHLLTMVELDKPIDTKHLCLVLQHLTMEGMGSAWGGPVLRLAERLNIDLPARPWDWHHGLSLQGRDLPT